MALFMAEGLLEAARRGIDPAEAIRAAYLRWLRTQEGRYQRNGEELLTHMELWSQRAPGTTCLTGLRSSRPVANSKGCSGAMRVAPVGLAYDRHIAFSVGCQAARITHGHPTGYLSAGAFAAIVAGVVVVDGPAPLGCAPRVLAHAGAHYLLPTDHADERRLSLG